MCYATVLGSKNDNLKIENIDLSSIFLSDFLDEIKFPYSRFKALSELNIKDFLNENLNYSNSKKLYLIKYDGK